MLCPNCQTETKEVKLDSLNPGFVIKIDQCPFCGGIWFDQYELFQIPENEASKIDKVNEPLLKENLSLVRNLFCPKDGSRLMLLEDYNIPRDLHIDQCPTCGGIWLNKGEFIKYKEGIKKLKSKKPNPKVQKLINSYLSDNSSKTETLALGKVGEYLMSPVAMTGMSPFDAIVLNKERNAYKLSPEELTALKSAPVDKKAEMYMRLISENKKEAQDEVRKIGGIAMGIISIIRLISRLIIFS